MKRRWFSGRVFFWLLVLAVTLFLLIVVNHSVFSPEPLPTQVPILDTSTPGSVESTEDPYLLDRFRMVEQQIGARGLTDPDMLRAMRTVPREKFVPPSYAWQAYSEHPLPIGYGQTISAPFIVGWMTQLLELKQGEKVLEIGTGSGYQAAILAELKKVEVYSIEIVPELAESARERLAQLGYSQIYLKEADGYYGWKEYAPFDAIIVTAAPDHLPPLLAAQLAEGGRMVIPIGPIGSIQTLWKFVMENGELTAYNLGEVLFVPFTGEAIKRTPTGP